MWRHSHYYYYYFFSWAPHVHQLGWFVAKSSALFSHRSEVKRMFEHHWLVSVSWWSLCKHSLLLRSSLVVEVTVHHRYSHLFWEWTPVSVIFSMCCCRSDFNFFFFLFFYFWVIFTTFLLHSLLFICVSGMKQALFKKQTNHHWKQQ